MLFNKPLADLSAKGIAHEVARLITSGQLEIGSRLPTVRELAKEIGVSPTTVSQAWKILNQAGMIETRGKLGSLIRETRSVPFRSRYSRISQVGQGFRYDLSTGSPDPHLLPDVAEALARIAARRDPVITSAYFENPLLESLEHQLLKRWPFRPDRMTVVDGGLDAIDRLFTTSVKLGDRVLVENPTFPAILDMVERRGAEPIGLAMDDEGILPEALEAARSHRPVALVVQPRAQNPSGISMSSGRVQVLAKILTGTEILVIEDDHAAGISDAPKVSFGNTIPERTVRIWSLSQAFGPDIRLAGVGGAAEPIAQLIEDRTLGPNWSSRLLQQVAADLLSDTSVQASAAMTREIYADRRLELLHALRSCGVEATGSDGINLWVPVVDESDAMITLAANGIAVAPGAPFFCQPGAEPHIRVTCSTVADNYAELAQIIADAATTSRLRTAKQNR